MQNPFEYGRELGPGELADREAEVEEVRRALTGGGKHFLIGPRRYGKTSIHNVAAELARAKGAAVLRYNAEAYPSLDDLLRAMVADAAQSLTSPVEKAAALITKVFAQLRPTVKFDPLEQTWSVSLGVSARTSPVPRLVEVLHGFEKLAAKRKTPLGLVIDEVQHLVAEGESAERQIRAAIQTHKKVGYVFAGSDTRLLTAMTTDPDRPFYRLGTVRILSEIPRPAFRAYLNERFAALTPKVERAALDVILDEAQDVPYNVQLLAYHCWTMLRDGPRGAALTPALVHAAHAAAAQRLGPAFSTVWSSLTLPQRRALQAVVLEDGRGLYSKAVAERYLLPASGMKRALEALVARQICRVRHVDGDAVLRLEDPLFGRWVRTVVVAPMLPPA